MDSKKFPYFHSKHPIVIKNKISKWEVLNYTEDEWCKIFGTNLWKFRQGDKTFKMTPYWEQMCSVKEITLKEFFETSKQKKNTWLYFDYNHMKDIFSDNEEFLQKIRWMDLGLFNLSGEDSTLWIGNSGAHTSCHMDTYGCNFVAQIFGRKLWILMPPEEGEKLNPTRVPYEESSVYSSYNFYTPNKNILNISHAYSVILSPGDVLFVPRHWWHYVENLEVSISINVWIPLEVDHESRLEESLVRYYVSNICNDLMEEEAKQLLNPNEYKLLTGYCSFYLIQKCIENYKKFTHDISKGSIEIVDVKTKFDDVVEVEKLDTESYIKDKSKFHNYDPAVEKGPPEELDEQIFLAKCLINSYCDPKNLSRIKESFLHHYDCVK